MIGSLPKSLMVNGTEYEIRSDYRVGLLLMQAFDDVELDDREKIAVLIECLYVDSIPAEYIQEAINQAVWYLNCGNVYEHQVSDSKKYDWEQDEQLIFSAVNKVAGKEIRALEYMHWWTFIGLFNEIGEGTFSTIVSIRDKRNKHKKLEKWEQEFLRKNPDMVKLKKKLTEKEKEEQEFIRNMLKGGS